MEIKRRQAVQYGERKRPGHESKVLLIYAQVAYAPRTVPLTQPSMYSWRPVLMGACSVLNQQIIKHFLSRPASQIKPMIARARLEYLSEGRFQIVQALNL